MTDDGARVQAGAHVGDYVIERFIGAGAMGEVHAGRHPVIGKRVAIKILRPELAASAEAGERFIREARAVNQIDHENVVDVFAFGRLDDGRLYLVMDLVEGRSLRAYLVDGPLAVGTAIEILEPIADALDTAHGRGVVHRDLKPDNIVLSNATPPKVFVLDFGIAKLIATASGPDAVPPGPGTLTGAGTWLGTPSYMAPEQWSVDGAGPASDRYALGVIAFELLTGAPPFSASSTPQMMEQHFRAEVPRLSARGALGLPAGLDGVLRKALAKDPAERFESARAFVRALREAAGSGAMRARGPIAARGFMGRDGRGKRLWIPAIAGVLVLGAGAAAVALVPGDPRGGTPPARVETALRGTVQVGVTTSPEGAEVRTARGAIATTPGSLYAVPGETLELTIRKGGYATTQRSVLVEPAGMSLAIKLDSIDGFAGVWQLPSAELRAFERRDDHVDAFKLGAISGPRTFFTQYAFSLADQGAVFGGEEVVADPQAPNEPTCNVRMRVDYAYDPAADTLEQRREHVELDFVNGKCVVRDRHIEAVKLQRVDRGTHESHEIAMPVGTPKQVQKTAAPPTKTQNVVPVNPNTYTKSKNATASQPKASRPTKATVKK